MNEIKEFVKNIQYSQVEPYTILLLPVFKFCTPSISLMHFYTVPNPDREIKNAIVEQIYELCKGVLTYENNNRYENQT